MKVKFTILVLFFLISNSNLKSQNDSIVIAKNAVYIEGVGIGGLGSINYERIFYTTAKFQLHGRIGISTINLNDFTDKFNPDLIFPIAVNLTYGNQHNVEIGIGQTYSNIVQAENGGVERNNSLSANFNIGYRYQKSNGGILFRCGYTPFIENYQRFQHWAGGSIGYAF